MTDSTAAASRVGDGGSDMSEGRRLAVVSVAVNAALAALNIAAGLAGNSAAVVAIGVEFAGDVLASAVVLIGLVIASRPPDANHPYGHGRLETIAGLFVGFVLMAGGAGIIWRALLAIGSPQPTPGAVGIVVLLVAIATRAAMATRKFRLARRLGSLALKSDAWNDAVDILSATVALAAVLLSRLAPEQFTDADRYGAVVVGLIVVLTGTRVARSATFDLADTMPDYAMLDAVRRVALAVPGVRAVEKHHARKTGLHYHVDLHVEVDPDMTVRDSHRIAHDVQAAVRGELAWVADVLIHIEPAGGVNGDNARAEDGSGPTHTGRG